MKIDKAPGKVYTLLVSCSFCYKNKGVVKMAFSFKNSKGKEYFLHVKKVKRASGKETELYYFSTDIRKGQEVEKVPAGKTVVELASGLPVLKKN